MAQSEPQKGIVTSGKIEVEEKEEVVEKPLEENEELVEIEGVGKFKDKWVLCEVGEIGEPEKIERHLAPEIEKQLCKLLVFNASLGSRASRKDAVYYLVDSSNDLNGVLKDKSMSVDRVKIYGVTNAKIHVRYLWEKHFFRNITLPNPKDNPKDFIKEVVKFDGWRKELEFERIKLEDVNKPRLVINPIMRGATEPEGARKVKVVLSVEWRGD